MEHPMRLAIAVLGGLGVLALAAVAGAREAIDEVPCDETLFADARTFSCEEDVDPLLDLDSEELAGCTIDRLRVRVRGGRLRIRVVTESCRDLGRPKLRARFDGPAGCPALDGVVVIDGERYPVALVGLDRAEVMGSGGAHHDPDEPVDPSDPSDPDDPDDPDDDFEDE
jgi:hypothetical protein